MIVGDLRPPVTQIPHDHERASGVDTYGRGRPGPDVRPERRILG